MLALRVAQKKLSVKEVEKPERADEALVRVVLSGICNTDLEIARGYAGFNGTIGHVFVGVDESGQRVVGEINAGCGKCQLVAQVIQDIALHEQYSAFTAAMVHTLSFFNCLE